MASDNRLVYYVSLDDDNEVSGLFRADFSDCETFIPPDEWRPMPPTFGMPNLEGLGGDAHYRRIRNEDIATVVPKLKRQIAERRGASE